MSERIRHSSGFPEDGRGGHRSRHRRPRNRRHPGGPAGARVSGRNVPPLLALEELLALGGRRDPPAGRRLGQAEQRERQDRADQSQRPSRPRRRRHREQAGTGHPAVLQQLAEPVRGGARRRHRHLHRDRDQVRWLHRLRESSGITRWPLHRGAPYHHSDLLRRSEVLPEGGRDLGVSEDLGRSPARGKEVEGGGASRRSDRRSYLGRRPVLRLPLSLELRRVRARREGERHDRQQADARGAEVLQGALGRCHGSRGRNLGRLEQQPGVSEWLHRGNQQWSQRLSRGVEPGGSGRQGGATDQRYRARPVPGRTRRSLSLPPHPAAGDPEVLEEYRGREGIPDLAHGEGTAGEVRAPEPGLSERSPEELREGPDVGYVPGAAALPRRAAAGEIPGLESSRRCGGGASGPQLHPHRHARLRGDGEDVPRGVPQVGRGAAEGDLRHVTRSRRRGVTSLILALVIATCARTSGAQDVSISRTITVAPAAKLKLPKELLLIIRVSKTPDTKKGPTAVKRVPAHDIAYTSTLGEEDITLDGSRLEGKLYVTARVEPGDGGGAPAGSLEGGYPRNPVSVGAKGVDIGIGVAGAPPTVEAPAGSLKPRDAGMVRIGLLWSGSTPFGNSSVPEELRLAVRDLRYG